MQASDLPPTVAARRGEIGERLADAPGVLLCLDFDGTLAPIVEDPDAAAIDPDCRSTVAALADRPDVEVAVVSGREIRDLRDRVGLETVVYAGNHGLELRRSGETEVHPDARTVQSALESACQRVAERTADVPGCEIENKRVTATVHYRRVPDERVPAVIAAVERAVAATDADLEVSAGKEIREIRPAVSWDKGAVVEELSADVPAEWVTVYVGDDTTDEDAFEVLGDDGIAVHVGRDEETAADYRLEEQSAVRSFLDMVAEKAG